MEILMMPNQKILACIGEQPVYANKDYRFMKYCLVKDKLNGKIIYNGLTCSMVFLTNEEIGEIGNINKYPFLYRNYFLVSEDFDEKAAVDKYRKISLSPVDDLYLNNPVSFTVLTTTRCNARCFYCYELNAKHKKHMTDDVAHKVADYINTYAPMDKQINIAFFGGEPLFNQKAIDIIVNGMINFNRPFTTTFTSNGYLFTKELAIKAKNIWNTIDCQITIDGTESVYNKTKNYIYKDDSSPYKRVLNNIAILLNIGISVTIRLNVDNYNGDDLKKLVIELHNRFGNHPNLNMYGWPIFEDENFHRTPEEHIKCFDKLREIEETMDKCGYMYGYYPLQDMKIYQCMADDGKSVIISPNGDLGVCEHFIDKHFWGHVNDPLKKDFNELTIWREHEPELDICNDCPLYPMCVRPSYCEEMRKCDPYFKEWRIRRHLKGLDWSYGRENNNNMPYRLSENIQ